MSSTPPISLTLRYVAKKTPHQFHNDSLPNPDPDLSQHQYPTLIQPQPHGNSEKHSISSQLALINQTAKDSLDRIVDPIVDWVKAYNSRHGLPEGYELAPPASCRLCDTVTSLTDELPQLTNVWFSVPSNGTHGVTVEENGLNDHTSSSYYHYFEQVGHDKDINDNNQSQKTTNHNSDQLILARNHSTTSTLNLSNNMVLSRVNSIPSAISYGDNENYENYQLSNDIKNNFNNTPWQMQDDNHNT
jgi:hypothetical protein